MPSFITGRFADLWGTIKGSFHVAGPNNPCIGVNPSIPDVLYTRKADEATVGEHDARSVTDSIITDTKVVGTANDYLNNHLVALMDLRGRCPNIMHSFAGTSNPSGGSQGEFWICSATGGTWTVGDIAYKRSSSVWIKVPKDVCSTLTTGIAVTMTLHANLMDNAVYAWEGGAWVLKGSVGTSGGLKVLKISTTDQTNQTSSAQIADGDIIHKVLLDVTTAYATGTIQIVTTGASPIVLMSTADNVSSVVAQYENGKTILTSTDEGGAVTLDVDATSGSGACTAYIVYGTPLT